MRDFRHGDSITLQREREREHGVHHGRPVMISKWRGDEHPVYHLMGTILKSDPVDGLITWFAGYYVRHCNAECSTLGSPRVAPELMLHRNLVS